MKLTSQKSYPLYFMYKCEPNPPYSNFYVLTRYGDSPLYLYPLNILSNKMLCGKEGQNLEIAVYETKLMAKLQRKRYGLLKTKIERIDPNVMVRDALLKIKKQQSAKNRRKHRKS